MPCPRPRLLCRLALALTLGSASAAPTQDKAAEPIPVPAPDETEEVSPDPVAAPPPDVEAIEITGERLNDANVQDEAQAITAFTGADQDKDTDGDCSDGVGGDCRLDECECGDQDGNGRVNVTDIVDINLAIFGTVPTRRLCDGNSDLSCNVSDIVAANVEIFNPDSSSCRHITSGRCGNSAVDPGEACADGARCQGGTAPGTLCDATAANTCPGVGAVCRRVGGDGCNTSCRIE